MPIDQDSGYRANTYDASGRASRGACLAAPLVHLMGAYQPWGQNPRTIERKQAIRAQAHWYAPIAPTDINLVGRIMRTDVQLEEKFRPLRTVEERRAKRKKDTTPQKERGPIPSSDDEREKDPPIQLSV